MKGNVVIIGAGRSGRGMLGELYDSAGYKIVFADCDADIVYGLRRQGFYTVQMMDLHTGECTERRVENFQTVHVIEELDEYMDALLKADWISTALLPKDFDSVILDLAKAISLRHERKIDTPMYITLGANYVGLQEYFDTRLRKQLAQKDLSYYEDKVNLIMSIVNRKNLLPEQKTEDKFRVIGDNKSVLRVESISAISKGGIDLPSFFRLEANLNAAMAIKIWSGNLVQCSMAFVALSEGCSGTWEASMNAKASEYAYYASCEGYRGVALEYGLPDRTQEEMRAPVSIFRTHEFSDSLLRIVREPIRKLARNDRFIGPALCCIKHGILPYYIAKCMAYVFLYNNEKDPQSLELQQMLKEKGVEDTVITCCGLSKNESREKLLIDLIVNAYYEIDKINPMDQ